MMLQNNLQKCHFARPDPDLPLTDRTEKWINAVATGKLNGQQMSAADQTYANELQRLTAPPPNGLGYSIKPLVADVTIPKTGVTGNATVVLNPVQPGR